MIRLVWILIFMLVFGCGYTSSDEKHLELLMKELGIEFTCESDSNYVVIIPGNGCGSCIQDALDEMRESEDTTYIFICDSDKDFYLLSGGKRASSMNNLYLDKKKLAIQMEMVQTYPLVYIYTAGRLVSREPYQSKRRLAQGKDMTVVALDKSGIDLGRIEFDQLYKDSIKIFNKGKSTLHLQSLRSSCECTEVVCSQKEIRPMESEMLYITFRPDAKGEFERFVFVDCNVKESVLEIPIKGIVY